MFRRRRRSDEPGQEAGADVHGDEQAVDDEFVDEQGEPGEAMPRPPASRALGPWDMSEVADPAEGRADLGGIMVPVRDGMELRVEVQQDQVVAATAVAGQSAIQLQAFAAPRSEDIWDEVRHEIASGITQQGGLVDEREGPFGTELRAQVPIQLDDGTSGVQVLRFVGCDGPRWFLRGVVSGQAAVQPESGGAVEDIFRDTVVVRGGEPMAPRDPIPLRLPQHIEQQVGEGADRSEADLNPFQRGPEITEVR